MGKIIWMENGRSRSRNFDMVLVQFQNGTSYTAKFAGNLTLVNDGRVKVLEILHPPYQPAKVAKGGRHKAAFLMLGGILLMQLLDFITR